MAKVQRRLKAAATRTADARRQGSTAAPWWMLALIALFVGAAYSRHLDAPFIFDDTSTIVDNPFLARLWPLTEAMRAPVQSAFAGRPVAALSLAVSHAAAGGLSPAGFRAWNVAFLLASSLLLFGLVRRTLLRADKNSDGDGEGEDEDDGGGAGPASARSASFVALAIALLWAVHPLQSEVIGYVTQRTESLMGLFYLLTLHASVRASGPAPSQASSQASGQARSQAPDRLSPAWVAIAVLASALGMLTKESMVTVPVMVILYDLTFSRGSVGELWQKRRALYVGLAATWLLLVAANIGGPRFRSAGFTAGVSPVTYLLNQGPMIATYLKLAFWPHPLVLDYGLTEPIAWSTALPGVLLVAVLLVGVLCAWVTSHRVIAFLGAWFFLTLAPTSSVIPIATEVGAERRMYLPLVAVIAAVVLGLRALARRSWSPDDPVRRPWNALAVALVAAVALTAVTTARMRAYGDPLSLWQETLAVHPQGRAQYNLGVQLAAAGKTAEAIEAYRAAVTSGTAVPGAHYALGFESARAGQHAAAVSEFREFLKQRPDDAQAPKASFLLGQSLAQLGKTAEAEQAYRETLRMVPAHLDARLALADLYLGAQRFNDAIALYRDYLQQVPDSAEAHHNLGMALLGLEQEAASLPEFERAAALRPSDANMQMSLGQALATAGRLDDAVDHLRAAFKLAPNDPRVMSSLAVVLAAGGEVDDPLALFARARQLAPNDPVVQGNYDLAVARWRGQHQQN